MTNRVILIVGVVLVLSVLGIIALSTGLGSGKPIPDILQNIASGALAGLLGLLAPRRRGRRSGRRRDGGTDRVVGQ